MVCVSCNRCLNPCYDIVHDYVYPAISILPDYYISIDIRSHLLIGINSQPGLRSGFYIIHIDISTIISLISPGDCVSIYCRFTLITGIRGYTCFRSCAEIIHENVIIAISIICPDDSVSRNIRTVLISIAPG